MRDRHPSFVGSNRRWSKKCVAGVFFQQMMQSVFRIGSPRGRREYRELLQKQEVHRAFRSWGGVEIVVLGWYKEVVVFFLGDDALLCYFRGKLVVVV